MCIIVYQKSGEHVGKRTLRRCWAGNPDGAGFMWAEDGKVEISKGHFTFRSLYRTYRAQQRLTPDADFVLHFRIQTSGGMDYANCHPFRLAVDLGFVHNGILATVDVPPQSIISDTGIFCRDILGMMKDGFLESPGVVHLLEVYAVANASKFIFLDGRGNVTISNEDAGVWDGGIWYSGKAYQSIVACYTANFEDRWKEWDGDYNRSVQRGRLLDALPNEPDETIPIPEPVCTICSGHVSVGTGTELDDGSLICGVCAREYCIR